MESYSLFQLNEYIRRVIALNFREPLWIEAEIVQCKESKGNFYLELVEKDDASNNIIAQAQAAIWYKNYQFIKRKLGEIIQSLLKEGTQVRIKCRVDFNERYGFKLIVEDIDPNFTFGQLELKRQKIIQRLQEEGLMELNEGLVLPVILQKIAVISSSTAAGYQDFHKQLSSNSYGYQFDISLFDVAVQGTKVENDISNAINEIQSTKDSFDAVVIIRGGGSKLDLAAFDNYKIAKSIALSNIPFIIGIGHDIDSTVTDLVSCISVKTPTAVADFLIEKNLHFESNMETMVQTIFQNVNSRLNKEQMELSRFIEKIDLLKNQIYSNMNLTIDHLHKLLVQNLGQLLINESNRVERFELILQSLDPGEVLKRGYSYIKLNEQMINSKKQLHQNDIIDIHLSDGITKGKIL